MTEPTITDRRAAESAEQRLAPSPPVSSARYTPSYCSTGPRY